MLCRYNWFKTCFKKRVKSCGTQDPYSAGYANVALNVGALNAFYRAIPPPYDKDSYLLTVDCMLELRAYMGAQLYSNFYYTLDFAVYEFPFTWFYQCMVMTESAVDPTSRFSQVRSLPVWSGSYWC